MFTMDCRDEAAYAPEQQFNKMPNLTAETTDEDEFSPNEESFFSDEQEVLLARGELFDSEYKKSNKSRSISRQGKTSSTSDLEETNDRTKKKVTKKFPRTDSENVSLDIRDDKNDIEVDSRISLPVNICNSDCPVILKLMKRKNKESASLSSAISSGYFSLSLNYTTFLKKKVPVLPSSTVSKQVKTRTVQQPTVSSASLIDLKLKYQTSASVNRSNSFTYIFQKDNQRWNLDDIALPLRLSNLGRSSFLSNYSTFSSDYRVEALIRPLVFAEAVQPNNSSEVQPLEDIVVTSHSLDGVLSSPSVASAFNSFVVDALNVSHL